MNFWQCFVLCMISIQETAVKDKLFRSLIQITFKNKQAKNIFYLKK